MDGWENNCGDGGSAYVTEEDMYKDGYYGA